MPHIFPKGFTLLCEDGERRLTMEQACACVSFVINGHLRLAYRSPIKESEGRQWMECNAHSPKGRYTFVFGVKDDVIVTLWAVLTPSGQQYSLQKDGDNPCLMPQFSRPECRDKLTEICITRPWAEEYAMMQDREAAEAALRKAKAKKKSKSR